jgi:hypothetical protein
MEIPNEPLHLEQNLMPKWKLELQKMGHGGL